MNACAFVVGPREGSGAVLSELARGLGFPTVLPYAGLAQAERQAMRTPLCFFLFAETDELQRLNHPARQIRFTGGHLLRFAPLIYFSSNPSVETIKSCIQMGFDDVITGPFTPKRAAPRLERQIGTELVYYETSSYFGPDRRGRMGEQRAVSPGTPQAQFRRIEIVRSYATGINVLRDDLQIVL